MSIHAEFAMPVVKTREQQAAEIRAAFPECSNMVDEMKALFGEVSVVSLTENGVNKKTKSYKPDTEFSAVIDGADYLRLGKLSQQAFDAANRKAKDAK